MSTPTPRREFLKTTAAAAAIGTTLSGLSLTRSAHAAGNDVLKVGLIGCGSRGTGAVVNALNADPNCVLYAMADAFPDRLNGSLDELKKQFDARITVSPDRQFVGFEAGQKLIESGVDVVLLAEPPHFRPIHLKAAVEAGKHVFCEKPVAVDAPGVRSVLASAAEAKKKGLNLVGGLCWRYAPPVRETMKRILNGEIGEIRSIQETFMVGTAWHRPRQPDWTEMTFQLRNWYYFTWLSGDFNTEQHIHSLDKAVWAMGEQVPERAWGLGGRQVRTAPTDGDIYDHHAVVYEYPNGVRVHAYCRQIAGCFNDVSDIVIGSRGTANVIGSTITGEKPWRYKGSKANMYDVQHRELFAAIRAGKTINDGQILAHATMMAILGRMVDYTGEAITWEQAMASTQTLAPSKYSFDADPPTRPDKDGRYPIAMPGITKFS